MEADVLVVGAGIAGLTLAARLQAHGVDVRVAEQAPALRTTTAGIVLHPNARACLGGLAPALTARGAPIERQIATDPDGSRTLVDWRAVWGDRGLPLAVHRRVLAEHLLASVAPGTVAWSAPPRALAQERDAVAVAFADGGTHRYRLVVGADGVRSWVRGVLDPGAVPRFSGHTFVRTTVPAAAPLDFPEWRVWRGGNHFFGAMPAGLGRMAIFLQIAGTAPVKVAPRDAHRVLRDAVRPMDGEACGLVAAMVPDEGFVTRPAYSCAGGRTVGGRVAVIGDAAHPFSPATTQGGGMAAEDAAVLAEEIAKHGCEPAALISFERRRRPRVARFNKLARMHVTLMDGLQRQRAQASGHEPGTTAEASRWYRRLYGPLLEPP